MDNDIKGKSIVRAATHFAFSYVSLGVADLTEPIDVYSEWIDAADAAQKEAAETRRAAPSTSRTRPRAEPVEASDEE